MRTKSVTWTLSLHGAHRPTNSILFIHSCKQHRWGDVYLWGDALHGADRENHERKIRVRQRRRVRARPQGAVGPTPTRGQPGALGSQGTRWAALRGEVWGHRTTVLGGSPGWAPGKALARPSEADPPWGFGQSGHSNMPNS